MAGGRNELPRACRSPQIFRIVLTTQTVWYEQSRNNGNKRNGFVCGPADNERAVGLYVRSLRDCGQRWDVAGQCIRVFDRLFGPA